MNKSEAPFAVQLSLFNKEYVVFRLPTAVYHRLPIVVQDNLHEFKYFLKFAVVGTTGAIVDLGTLFLLNQFVWSQPEVWESLKYVAITIAFCAAVVNNYSWNILWTYNHQDHSDQHHITLSKFTLVSVMGLLINWTLVFVVHDVLGFRLLIGKLTAMGVVMFWKFIVNRLWTFKV
jgi:putative flippase GtrA